MMLRRQDEWVRIPPRLAKNPKAPTVVLDMPGAQEEKLERSFVGPAAVELAETLKLAGKTFDSVNLTYALSCRIPNDDIKVFNARLRKDNRRRIKNGEPPLPSPIECCKPRLLAEIEESSGVITAGPMATKAVLGGNTSLMSIRGGPTISKGKKVMPTLCLNHVRINPMWRPVLRADIAKAFRHFKEALNWEDPRVVYNPSAEWLSKFFAKVKEEKTPVAYDVETDGIQSLTTGLRCIGFATTEDAVVVGLRSIDGQSTFYEPHLEKEIRAILREFFLDKSIVKVAHNGGYFDRIIVEQHLGITPAPLVDTILLHRLAEPEYPHNLGFIGSMLTDVPSWKADHTATTAQTDADLHKYCAVDCVVTARILPPLADAVKALDKQQLYGLDRQSQKLCVGMHRLGLTVDEKRRAEHEKAATIEAAKWLNVIHSCTGMETLNPNSHDQVRSLLYGKWQLPPSEYTSAGEPSTDDASLRSLLANPLLSDDERRAVFALRRYRKANKLLTTYLRKLAPNAGVLLDGRVHADFNAHGTVTGRYSSSNPNFQNIPYSLRDIFVAPKGYVFVGADFDQLELRLAAALAGAQHYLDAFEKGHIDPHNLTGELMFGEDVYWNTEGAPKNKALKGSGRFKKLRDLSKTICYASLYGASTPTVFEALTKAEDDNGNLIYANTNLRQVRTLHKRWKKKAPEFAIWWDESLATFRHQGYIEDPVLGRRKDFINGEKFNEIVNFPVQAGGFGVVLQGMLDLVENYLPFNFKEGTGMVNQCHDSVLFLVKENDAEYAQEAVQKCFTRKVPNIPVLFTAEAHVGQRWSEV